MTKGHILAEIKRLAVQNNGKPLGRARFEQATGIKSSAWLGKIWTRWNDAIEEAGLAPNSMKEAYTDEELLEPLVSLIRDLRKFPTQAEQSMARRRDSNFPPPDCIRRRWGNKGQIAARVMDYCIENQIADDVIEICSPLATTESSATDGVVRPGQVYLLKHDNAYKIGKSTDATRRYKEIRTQMPHDTEEIQVIETDDIDGIEAYWHKRFAKKRLNGEWFNLSPSDVKAFKRRKYM